MFKYLAAFLFLSFGSVFGATTQLTDGLLLSVFDDSGELNTFTYEIAAKPYSNRKLQEFTIFFDSDGLEITNITSNVNNEFELTNTYLKFFNLQVTNQSTVTFSFSSSSSYKQQLAQAFDSQVAQDYMALVPNNIPEPSFFLLTSLGAVVFLRRSR